jgi:hypothetical protein
MKNILKLTAILLILAGGFSCSKENTENTGIGSPHRENIIGKWKLVEIITVIGYGNENADTVDYSNSNIIYDFQNDSILIITGYVPNDLSEGEHTYEYTQPPFSPYAISWYSNLSINNIPDFVCIAFKKEIKMTISGEIIPPAARYIDEVVLNSTTRIYKKKTFIKIN